MNDTTSSISPRHCLRREAVNTARTQIKDIAESLGLTTQERLDLLAELTACAALDEVDRTEGWQVRSVGVLTALQASAVERLQSHLSQAD